MKVYNHDIAGLVKRLRRFKFELVKSVSANLGDSSAHDLARVTSYLNSLKDFKAWVISQPELDLPETSPMEIEIGEPLERVPMDNDDLEIIANLMHLLEAEIVNSQSARRSSGMVSHDNIRFDLLISKIENFISGYMASNSPLDLPESNPNSAMTGPGRVGV